MRDDRQGFLRRRRSEWAPMAWDLGEPVEILWELPWFSPPPELGFSPSPEQTTMARLNDHVGRLEELDVAWKAKYLIGWPHDPKHRGYDGPGHAGELLLYPQGFVQEVSNPHYGHPSCLSFYKVTDDLVPHLRSMWSSHNSFVLSNPAPHRGPRFVTHQRLSEAWRVAGASSPPPQPTSAGLGWLVFRDGRLIEILDEYVAQGQGEADALEVEDFVDLQLPKSMTSFLFELHTKGTRRYHKQAILGAFLTVCGFVGMGSLARSATEVVWMSVAGVWVAGMYHFCSGRGGVRDGLLSRAVSCGLFRDHRLPSSLQMRSGPAGQVGPRKGRLAPWFIWGVVKRGAVALVLLCLAAASVASVVPVDRPLLWLLWLALVSLCMLAALETLMFWSVTKPERW